jgi:hypothetical protein
VRERRNLGRTEEDEAQDKCLQYDVIQWLCVRDQTYSQVGLPCIYIIVFMIQPCGCNHCML